MLISEVANGLTDHYRAHRKANGGHKTSLLESGYGYKSIQYRVVDAEGNEFGPFLGRGKALHAYRDNIKLAGKVTHGVKFLVDEITIAKDKERTKTVDNTVEFVTTERVKAATAKPVAPKVPSGWTLWTKKGEVIKTKLKDKVAAQAKAKELIAEGKLKAGQYKISLVELPAVEA